MASSGMAIFILLGSFVLLIVFRCPIAFAIGISSALTIRYLGMPLSHLCMLMVNGLNSFSLMAVPFFILMGEIMSSGGISKKLIDLSNALVGWMRGGLAMVNIVASLFFGGISGSAAADTASLGTILIPMMVDQGYDADFSAAVTVTSSCEGLLIPPSHNLVIYAMVAGGVSVGKLFLAGYFPGFLLAISLMIFSYILSVKRNYPKSEAFSIKVCLQQLFSSFWALCTVLIVVIGVVLGLFTATESAAIAVIYSLLISLVVYKGTDLKGIWESFGKAINTLAIVLLLISTSSAFGWCLTYLHVPELVTRSVLGLTTNRILILLIVNVILLVLGMIMDMSPIILVVTPILLPLVQTVGMDAVQFGILLILNCGIGLLTPPVGAVLFIGSGIAKVKIEELTKTLLPFYGVMFIVLMLITFCPFFTTGIASLLLG